MRAMPKVLQYSLYAMGVAAVAFQLIKASTTGLWYDEAWIIENSIYDYIEKKNHDSNNAFPSAASQNKMFHFGVSSGPTILLPGLLATLLKGHIHPPTLHLFIFLHTALFWISC